MLLIAALLVPLVTQAQITTFPYTNGFESGLDGWTVTDADNDGYTWLVHTQSYYGSANGGSAYLVSESYGELDGSYDVLYPDNWLISPAITIPSGENYDLSWWVKTANSSYPSENYSVYVGTTGTAAALGGTTPVYTHTMLATEDVWAQITVSLASYAGQTVYIGFRHHNCSDQLALLIDDIYIGAAPTCFPPTGLAVNVSDPDAVVINWNGEATASGYDVVVINDTVTFDETTATIDYVTDTFTVVNNLDPDNYKVYVRSNCGSGDVSTWVGPVHFTTLPIYMMPTTGTATITTCNMTIYDVGGPDGQYENSSNSTLNIYPSDPTKVLQLWGNSWTESSYDYLTITDLATNEVLFCDNTSSVYSAVIDTVVVYGGVQLNFHSDGSVCSYDGFEVHVACIDAPSCMPVQGLAATRVTSDSVYLGWTDTVNSGAYYLVEYRPADSNGWDFVEIYDTFAEIGDLTINTLYEFRVTALCGGSDSSITVGPITVRTLAGEPISEFPYSCGFENNNDVNEAADWVFENGTQTNYWMVGEAVNNGGSKALYITNDGSANSYTVNSSSYVFAYATFDFEAGEYAYSYDWRAQGESCCDFIRAAVVPNSVEFTAGDYCGFSSGSDVPAGGIAIDGGGKLNQQNSWQTRTGTFNIATAGVYKMVFLWRNDGSVGTQTPAAIDNIQVVRNTCPAPSMLSTIVVTADSIGVRWNHGGTESEWIVSNGYTSETVTDTFFYFDQLYANTPYTISVTPICDDADTGMAKTLVVRTECGLMALPYNEDFESYANASAIPCWNYTMTNSSYSSSSYIPQAYTSTTSYYHHSGTTALRLYGVSYTALPELPIGIDSVSIGFWSCHTSSSYNLYLGVMTDPTDINTFDTIMLVPYTTTSSQQYFEHNFSGYTGTGRYIAFINTNGTSGYSYHYIDDISVWKNSNCPTLATVNMTGISNNQATVVWGDTSNGAYNNYSVYIGRTNNISMAEDSAVVSVGTNSYTFTGLTGNTNYYVWVRGNCSDEIGRALSVSFTTSVDCVPVQNLRVAGVDYHAFALAWDAPEAGYPATQYIVSWKHTSASTWTSDTTVNTSYYISGLGLDSVYDYRVTTICDSIVSAVNSGSTQTLGCGYTIGDGSSTSSYLPTYTFYDYSYTQQIFLSEELTGVDSIAYISFYNGGSSVPRNIVLMMANTTQSSFSSTSDYVPLADFDTVYVGQLGGTGWIILPLTNVFVRTAGTNLVVATDDNTGSYSSGPSWRTTTTSTARGMYFYQDNTNIDPAAPSANSSSVVNYVNQIRLVPPTCVIPDCSAPIVAVNNITANSADVVWNTEAGITYEVAMRSADATSWTILEAANTTGSVQLNNLSAGANYTVRVRMDCNGDTLTGTSNFWTACGRVDLPVYENFESHDFGVYSRPCWTIGSTNLGTQYPNPYVVSLTGDPNKLCLFYNGAYMILPQMNAPLNELQARFTLVQGGDSVRFLIGVMSDPSLPISTMHVLDTLIRSNIDTTSSTVQITYSFENIDLADTNGYIAFWDAFNDNYNFIDNLVVEYIPACTPASDVTVDNITTTSANVSWTSNSTSATGYIVEYGPRGFVPGSANGQTVTVTTTNATLNNLIHSTTYDVYVYTLCGTSDTSYASAMVRFATLCDAVTLPYAENFDNWAAPGTTYSPLPNCWSYALIGASTNTPSIYYTTNTGYASSGQYALLLSDTAIAVLPEMPTTVDNLMIQFHYYNTQAGAANLIIGAVDDNTVGIENTFVGLDTINIAGNSGNVLSFLTHYTGTGRYIALKGMGSFSNGPIACIDDIEVDLAPSCVWPLNVHTTSLGANTANLAWNVSPATTYLYEYGPHGFTLGTGTTGTVNTNSLALAGLANNTSYDIYVRAICSATDSSRWSDIYTFNTLNADPVNTFPWYCDFVDTVTVANCGFEFANGTQASQWFVGGAASNGTANALYVTNDGGATNNYNGSSASAVFAYRTMNLNAGEWVISYDWKCEGESSFDYLRVALVPYSTTLTAGSYTGWSSSAVPSNAIALDGGSKLNLNSSWTTVTETFQVPQSGTYNLVFFWRNDGSVEHQPAAAVDNIAMAMNTCPQPTNLAYTLDNGSATVTWFDTVPGLGWEVVVNNEAPIFTTTQSVTLSGLSYLTGYNIKVRHICSATDTGMWSNTISFSTGMCDSPFLTYSYDANDTNLSASTHNYLPLGYSYYNYGYTQSIIDSARISDMGVDEISAFAFKTNSSERGTYFTHIDVYMANIPDSLNLSSFIHPSADITFVKVIEDADFTFDSVGWFLHAFTTPFTWDGHSNVLVSINRRHGSYASSPYASFAVHTGSSATGKSRYIQQDGSAYDPATVSGGTLANVIPDLMFYSCGAGCARPSLLPVTNRSYNTATVNWNSNATDFEVAYKAVTDGVWPDAVAVSNATSYAINNLNPATQYQYRVRAICDATENLISDWAIGTFTTDSLPCFVPTDLHTTNVGYTSVNLAWSASSEQNHWTLTVWNTAGAVDYDVTGNAAYTVTGLTQDNQYYAAVKAICGNGAAESEYSDTIQFTTNNCEQVAGVTVNNITENSAVVSWQEATATSYEVDYGPVGHGQGQGTTVTV
ncbi:MAG: fibronectin type III domain-containing protein, partial [Bacteroidales bacterium]|nr:fibronectin type III domain-containing protein [Bacteroidales bacterium]